MRPQVGAVDSVAHAREAIMAGSIEQIPGS